MGLVVVVYRLSPTTVLSCIRSCIMVAQQLLSEAWL